VLILDEPTRGVDIGAKMIIHEAVERLADAGNTVILISSDLPELVGLSDRVMIMRKGRFTREMPYENAPRKPCSSRPMARRPHNHGNTGHQERLMPGPAEHGSNRLGGIVNQVGIYGIAASLHTAGRESCRARE
jgi:ABC-type multidrug transport system ATPase subunit